MNRLTQNIDNLLGLFFPELCVTCETRLISQEKFLCINCWHDMPVTNFHLLKDNKVAQLFWGRANIEFATSYFSYKKGSRYQQLIHYIKYKGLKELGFETGRRFGLILLDTEIMKSVDLIVPVPLHPKKERKRGFNQSYWIAKGIENATDKPLISDNLFRKVFSSTQTKKNRFERWKNVEDIFGVNRPEEFKNKHILLVDDVVTTGSTLEACAIQLLKIENTTVSIATLAFADF